MSVQLIALLTNIGLALMKFIIGTIASSHALLADAFNSAGDVVATLVAWLAFRYGSQPPDDDHPYGHANAEALAGLLIGGIICATGAFIFFDGLRGILTEADYEAPGQLAIWAALATAVIKEALYRVSIKVGRETNSPTLLASAQDHRADVWSATFALIGILVARMGYPSFDAAAGAVIGVHIFRLGFQPVRSNVGILMHEAHADITNDAILTASRITGVVRVGQVRSQPMGGRYRMDLTLQVNGDLTVTRAHEIAHEVERAILGRMSNVTEVHVHVEPDDPGV